MRLKAHALTGRMGGVAQKIATCARRQSNERAKSCQPNASPYEHHVDMRGSPGAGQIEERASPVATHAQALVTAAPPRSASHWLQDLRSRQATNAMSHSMHAIHGPVNDEGIGERGYGANLTGSSSKERDQAPGHQLLVVRLVSRLSSGPLRRVICLHVDVLVAGVRLLNRLLGRRRGAPCRCVTECCGLRGTAGQKS